MSYITTKIKPSHELNSDRLVLKRKTVDDAQQLFNLIDKSRNHLKPWMPWESNTKTVDDSLNYLKSKEKSWETDTDYQYNIFLKSTQEIIGSIGFFNLDWDNGTCEIGYWLGEVYEGKGYITESIKCLELSIIQLGFHKIFIKCDARNIRSRNIPKRLDYQLILTKIDQTWQDGQFSDEVVYQKIVSPPRTDELIQHGLPYGFLIRNVEQDSSFFWKTIQTAHHQIFDQSTSVYRDYNYLNDTEKASYQKISQRFNTPFMQYFILYHEHNKERKLAGWTFGVQDKPYSFYMVNSAILPEYRGKKLYSNLLDLMISTLTKEGFSTIWSRHNATNNNVIIPKLKRGFVISAMELSDSFGTLVHLTLNTNPKTQKVMKYRDGTQRYDDEIKNWMG